MLDKWNSLLEEWRGTPFMHGAMTPKMGVDCPRFVHAILCGLFDVPLVKLPIKVRRRSYRGLADVAKDGLQYHQCEVLPASTIPRMFDVVCSTDNKAGWQESHVGIVAPDTRLVWHANRPAGVQCTSLEALRTIHKIRKVYRPWTRYSPSFSCSPRSLQVSC